MSDRKRFNKVAYGTESAFEAGDGAVTQLPVHDVGDAYLAQDALEDMSDRTDQGEYDRIPGSKAGSRIAHKTYFRGLAAAATGLAVEAPLGELFKHFVGTQILGTGTTFTGAGTALAPVTTDASGLSADTVILAQNGSTLVPRHIESKAVNTLTFSYAMPTTPTNTHVVYGSASYQYLRDITGSLNCDIGTELSADQAHLKGVGIESINMDKLSPKALPVLSVAARASDWERDDGSIPPATPTVGSLGAHMNAILEIVPYGTTAYSADYLTDYLSLGINMSRNLVDKQSAHGTQGVKGYVAGAAPFITFEITVYSDESPRNGTFWDDAFAAKQTFTLMWATSRLAGQGAGVWVREVGLLGKSQPGNDNGIRTNTLRFFMKTGHLSDVAMILFQY